VNAVAVDLPNNVIKMLRRFWRRFRSDASSSSPESVEAVMEGWVEEVPSKPGLRAWRHRDGAVMSLAFPGQNFCLPSINDEAAFRVWARSVAENRDAGLIEAHCFAGPQGPTATLIYKRLAIPAYIFTGSLFVRSRKVWQVWTIVDGEKGLTGMREAVITSELMNAGMLTRDDYERAWALDPYDISYRGVDRSVLRFVSDHECYDERFPEHPLSNIRRVLAKLPSCIA
jgi:hypothetical protein